MNKSYCLISDTHFIKTFTQPCRSRVQIYCVTWVKLQDFSHMNRRKTLMSVQRWRGFYGWHYSRHPHYHGLHHLLCPLPHVWIPSKVRISKEYYFFIFFYFVQYIVEGNLMSSFAACCCVICLITAKNKFSDSFAAKERRKAGLCPGNIMVIMLSTKIAHLTSEIIKGIR